MARYRVVKISHVPPGEMVAHFGSRTAALWGLEVQREAQGRADFDWSDYWNFVRTPYMYPEFWCIRRLDD